jgi:hypothetical protein
MPRGQGDSEISSVNGDSPRRFVTGTVPEFVPGTAPGDFVNGDSPRHEFGPGDS